MGLRKGLRKAKVYGVCMKFFVVWSLRSAYTIICTVFFTVFFALLASLACTTPPAHAEFIRSAPAVYQHSGKRLKIIISERSSYTGIFIALAKEEIELQEFDPRRVPAVGATHIFIGFDEHQQRYQSLFLGESEYQIQGSFDLRFDEFRISVDNTKPYLSIVYEPSQKIGKGNSKLQPDILGFLGTLPVVNMTGDTAIALFEANTFAAQRSLIQPYILKDQTLMLSGKPTSTRKVGLELEPQKNPCFTESTVFLAQYQLEEVKRLRDKTEKLGLLAKMLEHSANSGSFQDLLPIIVQGSSAFAFRNGYLYRVRPFKRNAKYLTCLVEEIRLEK